MNDDVKFEWIQPMEKDLRQVLEWRQDPVSAAMSFHRKVADWPVFQHQFVERFIRIPELPPLFALYERKRVAFVGFEPVVSVTDPLRKCCEISLIVAPESRGKGLGTLILQAASELVKQQGFDEILAQIKTENLASQKAFTAAGYRLHDKYLKEVPETGEIVPVQRYVCSLSANKAALNRVFVIAEAGSNWRVGHATADWDQARKMVDAAKSAGADAVKFQVFRAATVYVKNAGKSHYLAAAGIEKDIQDIYKDLAMPYEMIPKLAEHCKKTGIQFLASAFSEQDFQAIDPFVSKHKIASYEITYPHLIALAAKSGKPLILSTGAASIEDIQWALAYFYSQGGKDVTLLQCTAQYPAAPNAMNLRTINWLQRTFNVPVGLSDHSRDPVCAPLMAVALGASVIEKHFTLDNSLPGPDHSFAVTPLELEYMVKCIRLAEQMRGAEVKGVAQEEHELYFYARRGVQALRDIPQGEVLREGVNIAVLRPGSQPAGLHPRYLALIEGKIVKRSIPAGHGIQRQDV